MSLREVDAKIGFSDGEVVSCERMTTSFLVRFRAWNLTLVEVYFRDVQLIVDYMPGAISGLRVHDGDTELIQKALAFSYEEVPERHPYKHYVFIDSEDAACLEIVAASIELHSRDSTIENPAAG